MNRWRLSLIILILASIVLLIASPWFDWQPWNSLRGLDKEWGREPGYPQYSRTFLESPSLLTALGALFTLYLSGILVLFAIPTQIKQMEKAFSDTLAGLARLALLGLLFTILVMVIAIGSALTMGTFPITIFLGSILFLSAFTGFIALAYTLGRKLFYRAKWDHLSPLYELLVGVLVLYSLGRIPYLGTAFTVIFICLGTGVNIATRFGSGRSWDLSPLGEE